MTARVQGGIAEPEVRRRLRRRPPAAIRNGRSLMMAIAGCLFLALAVLLLGVLIGAKGAPASCSIALLVTLPIGLICIATVRLTRTRQLWALTLVEAWGLLIAVATGYLIATMASRQPDANATFFAQLALHAAVRPRRGLDVALPPGRALVQRRAREAPPRRGVRRAVDLGAARRRRARRADRLRPRARSYGTRFGAYLVDAILVGIPTALIFASRSRSPAGRSSSLLGVLAAAVISVGYFPFFWTRTGQTPGMRLTHAPRRAGVRARADDDGHGDPPADRHVVRRRRHLHRLAVGVRRRAPQGVARHRGPDDRRGRHRPGLRAQPPRQRRQPRGHASRPPTARRPRRPARPSSTRSSPRRPPSRRT